MTTLVKKERWELWLKISPWNSRYFSVTNLLYDVPWANWKLVAYLHTDIKVEVNFLLWGEKIGRWENLRLRPILSFPIQVWGGNDSKDETLGVAKYAGGAFWCASRGQNVKANQLWSPEELRHVARAVVEARIFSCYSHMMLRTLTLIHTTVPGHSFIPSFSCGWYFF